MTTKESDDDSTVDYEFLKKYIRDDSDKAKENQNDFSPNNFTSQKQGSTGIEVQSREGEGESYREETNFNKKPWQKNNDFEESDGSNEEEIESPSKPLTEAKKEFMEHMEDDSLTLDTASKLTYDWNNK
jgi:hypothetical protein